MNKGKIDKSVRYLLNSRKNFNKVDQTDFMPSNETEAYKIQNQVHKLLDIHGDKVIGKKIGCTTKVMQNYLNIDHPCAGTIRNSQCYESESILKFSDFHRVGVECELAIKLCKDVYYSDEPNIKELYDSIYEVIAAIEIVDDRYSDWKKFSANYLISDDFFSAGCVLGSSKIMSNIKDLSKLKGIMCINGKEVGNGYGKDILGHPMNAYSWIVSRKDIIGKYIPKGCIILLGSLVQTKWLCAGDLVEVSIEGIGSVKVTFV